MMLLCVACALGVLLLSIVISLLVFGSGGKDAPTAAPQAAALPYDAEIPFSLSDLSLDQQI